MAFPKRQHYVPQFYLKYFTTNEDEKLYVLDKEFNKIFHKNIQEICEQNYYYSFYEQDEYNFFVEEQLGKKENEFSNALRKLIDSIEGFYYTKTRPLNKLTHNDKKIILEFILYQIIRVPKYINELFSMVIPQFKQFNLEDGIVQTEKQIKNDIKRYTFPNLFYKIEKMTTILFQKNWMFFIISKNLNTSFISSDNPVIISNSDLHSPIRGALIDPMTEISIPISKNIALALKQKTVKYKLNYNIISTLDHVNDINGLLLKNANRFAYSGNKSLLE
jgi:hypothetical protein